MNLREYVEANPKLVKARPSERYPDLLMVKYTRKVFYDALWTPELEECRGLVVDKDWNPVIRPFKKIYNRGENGTDIPLSQWVECVDKINGFMAAATWVEGHSVVVSTTGSLDSPFVVLAEKHLKPNVTSWIDRVGHKITWLFEICDPTDPHIIAEKPGAYLIGARHSDGHMMSEEILDQFAASMQVQRPLHRKIAFNAVVNMVRTCQIEGYVVHCPGQPSLKIKSPYYLITKFLGRMRNEKFIERFEDMHSLRKTVDEEFYPLLNFLDITRDHFLSLDEQGRISFIKEFLSR
jgi:hypothetical protein